jgi:hypothetical protein
VEAGQKKKKSSPSSKPIFSKTKSPAGNGQASNKKHKGKGKSADLTEPARKARKEREKEMDSHLANVDILDMKSRFETHRRTSQELAEAQRPLLNKAR